MLTEAAEDLGEVLSETEFTIVGTVTTPNYMSQEKGAGTLDNLALNTFIYVPEETFLTDFYTVAYVHISEAEDTNSFSDEYEEKS